MSLILIGGKLYTLGGKLIGIGTGAQSSPPAATTFAIALSLASGVVGSTTTMTVTPESGGWPAGVALMPTATLAGSFAPPGPVNPTGTTAATFVFTSASPNGVGTLNAMASGMTSGGGQTYTSTVASSGTGGSTATPPSGTTTAAPAVLSDIIWHQPEAIDPNSEDYAIAGWGEPVGGIGPFVWSTPDAGGYNCFDVYGGRGVVRVYGGMPTSLSFRLTCVDARGASITKTFTVNVASTSPTMSCNDINPVTNCTTDTFYGAGPFFRPTAPGVQSVYTGVTLQDGSASTQWVGNYGPKWYQGGAAVIPPGSYPVKFTGTSNGNPVSENYTIQITATPTAGYIEIDPVSISTSTVPGRLLGKARATTPNNAPIWSITGPAAAFIAINQTTGQRVLKSVPTAGSYAYSLTVADATYTYTQSFSLVVAQGNVIAPSNMALTLDKSFTNYFYNAPKVQRNVSSTGPVLSGFPDLTKVSWYVSNQQRFNWTMDNPYEPSLADPDEDMRGGIGYKRIACDPASGMPFVQAQLSDTTGTPGEWFDLTATDGINNCTRRFYIQVSAVVGPKLYVGPNTPPAGFTKVATIRDALAPLNCYDNVDVTSHAGTEVRVEYNPANPNIYAGDWESNYTTARADYVGPLTITGIPGPNGELPYYGGGIGSSNVSRGDKGLIIMNDGDLTISNMSLGDMHMGYFGGNYLPASNRTMSLVRRNGGKSGDNKLTNVDLSNADVPLENGNTDGQWILNNVRVYNGSGCTSNGGANQHNAYFGMCWNIIANNVLSYNSANGHIVKNRAANSTWTDCRFYDSERGSGFNAHDLPCAGNHSFIRCKFEKGPAAENPYLIQFGEEIPGMLPFTLPTQDYVNALSLDHCTLTCHATQAILGSGDRGFAAISFIGRIAPNTGVPSTLSITNTTFEGYTSSQVAVFASNTDPNYDFSAGFTQSGNTFSIGFATMDFTNPVSYGPARPGFHNSVAQIGGPANQNFPYFNARQIDPGVDEIRIAHDAAPGTVICANMRAYGCDNWSLSGNPQPDPRINPYVSGTAWAAGQTLTSYTGVPFGYANSKYVFQTNPDGITGSLVVGSGGLGAAGLDIILARATSPVSTGSLITENPFFVVKT